MVYHKKHSKYKCVYNFFQHIYKVFSQVCIWPGFLWMGKNRAQGDIHKLRRQAMGRGHTNVNMLL